MNAVIYGLVGHAGSVTLPLDELDLDELEAGREFTYGDKLYEIRSLSQRGETVHMNVVMILDHL